MPFGLFYVILIGRLALCWGNSTECPPDHQSKMTACLAQKLSDYALNFQYVTSDLSQLKCDAHNSISECWRSNASSKCSLADAKRSSEALTDVMLHRDMNATFLYGVLALDPICDAVKAKTLVAKHHACIKKYHEGKGMLTAVDKIHAQLADPALCQTLTTAGALTQTKVVEHCKSPELGQVMCKSVVTPFLTLHADNTAGCTVDTLCPKPAEKTATTATAGGAAASQNGGKANSGRKVARNLALLVSSVGTLAIRAFH